MAKCKHHEICGRDADENTGDGLCILHSRNPEKNKEAFDQALAEHRDPKGPNRNNKDNFSFFVFPGDTGFSHASFPDGVLFNWTFFLGKADFSASDFDGRVDFQHARFKSETNFSSTKVGGIASFANAHFRQVSFQRTKFKNWPNFQSVTFSDSSDFKHAKFFSGVDFSAAIFNRFADFTYAVFGATAIFGSSTRFKDGGNFEHSEFLGKAYFGGTVFDTAVSFEDCKFGAEATFSDGVFCGQFVGKGAVFSGIADFSGVSFNDGALFENARFRGEVNFDETQLGGPMEFWRATFAKGATFDRSTFLCSASFQAARFHGRTLFLPRKEDGKIQQVFSGAEVDFRWVTLEPPDVLVMRDADLSKCQFLGTDLRKAEITGAKWARIRDHIGVYDECCSIAMDATREWAHIERLYRELKQNYEDRKDYERARSFHYGEKEMRRINPHTPWGYRWFLLMPYWLISGYGERCLRPLAWAVLVLVVSVVAYMGGDTLCPRHNATGQACPQNIWEVLLYSLRVMLLLKPDDFVCNGLWGRLIYTGQSIAGPILIGLFGLALRQRLRR